MQKSIIIILSILIVIMGLIVFQSKRLSDKFTGFQEAQRSGTVITKMPDVSFRLLTGNNSYNFHKQDLNKKSLFLHFWATWCAPCEGEFPKLVKLIEDAKGQDISFVFVAVNDERTKILKFLKKFPKLRAIIVLDEDFIHQKHFGTYKLPETFLFDKAGNVIRKYTGAKDWSLKLLKRL